MKIIILFLITLISFENPVSLKSTISSNDLNIYTSPYVIKNTQNRQYYMLAFFYDDNYGYFKVFKTNNEEIYSKTINRRTMNRFLCFFYNDYFYFFSDKLFRLNISGLQLDSVTLLRNDYIAVNILNLDNRTILYAKTDDKIDLYDMTDYKIINSLKSKYGKPDIIKAFDNLLIFRCSENELTAYDLIGKKIKWKLNTGKSEAKLWGIKLGTFDNFITSYQVINNNPESFVYITTVIGDLYKLEALSGKVLIKRERFRGDDNNSGLITDLQYADINGDGIEDLICPSVDYNIYCINGKDLSILWQYDTGFENQTPIKLSDINNDGIPEVFNVNDKMTLSILSGIDGKCLLSYTIDEEKNQTCPLVGYFYGDEHLNVIVKANNYEIRVYELRIF